MFVLWKFISILFVETLMCDYFCEFFKCVNATGLIYQILEKRKSRFFFNSFVNCLVNTLNIFFLNKSTFSIADAWSEIC